MFMVYFIGSIIKFTFMKTATKNSYRVIVHEPVIYPPLNKRDKLAILRSVRGAWKNMKPDPIRWLKKMRSEPDRKLPSW